MSFSRFKYFEMKSSLLFYSSNLYFTKFTKIMGLQYIELMTFYHQSYLTKSQNDNSSQ